MLAWLLPATGFALAATFTPGPNNTMLAASGATLIFPINGPVRLMLRDALLWYACTENCSAVLNFSSPFLMRNPLKLVIITTKNVAPTSIVCLLLACLKLSTAGMAE